MSVRNNNKMLQNLSRIQKQKQRHLKKIQKLDLKQKSNKLETALQQKTLNLMSKQLQAVHALKLSSALRLICKKVYQAALPQIIQSADCKKVAQSVISKSKMVRARIFSFKIIKFLRRKEQKLRRSSISWLCSSLQYQDSPNCNNTAVNCMISNEQVNALSFLDISQISPQQNQHIAQVPFHLDDTINQHNYSHTNNRQKLYNACDTEQLESQISRKKQKIEQYRQSKQQQVKLLKTQLQNIQKCRSQQYSKITEAEYDEQQSSQPQSQQIDDEIVATMIKKNFELEEKLEIVYEIMSCVEPDLSTKFGQLLNKIIRKKARNIQLEA